MTIGREPKVVVRPDSIDGYFSAVSCFGGGCTTHAYANAKDADSKHNALKKAISKWNTRVEPIEKDFDIDKFIEEKEEEFRKMCGN